MTEQTVEEPVETYDAYEALVDVHHGALCPNENCRDRIFSYDDGPSTSCRCGLTWVCGGYKYLKYGVGAPFRFEDVRVISQRINKGYSLQEEIATEFEQSALDVEEITEESELTPEPDEVTDSLDSIDGETPEPSDEIAGPGPSDDVEA